MDGNRLTESARRNFGQKKLDWSTKRRKIQSTQRRGQDTRGTVRNLLSKVIQVSEKRTRESGRSSI